MDQIWQNLCEPHHLWMIIGVLLLAILLSGWLKPKELLKGLKTVLGHEVQVNLQGDTKMIGPHCPIDPHLCPEHAGEHTRSLENQAMIKAMTTKLELIDKRSRLMLIAMVSGERLTMQDVEGLI